MRSIPRAFEKAGKPASAQCNWNIIASQSKGNSSLYRL